MLGNWPNDVLGKLVYLVKLILSSLCDFLSKHCWAPSNREPIVLLFSQTHHQGWVHFHLKGIVTFWKNIFENCCKKKHHVEIWCSPCSRPDPPSWFYYTGESVVVNLNFSFGLLSQLLTFPYISLGWEKIIFNTLRKFFKTSMDILNDFQCNDNWCLSVTPSISFGPSWY